VEATDGVMHNIPEKQICCLGQTLISFDISCWFLHMAMPKQSWLLIFGVWLVLLSDEFPSFWNKV